MPVPETGRGLVCRIPFWLLHAMAVGASEARMLNHNPGAALGWLPALGTRQQLQHLLAHPVQLGTQGRPSRVS
jgi:hypothetical protein